MGKSIVGIYQSQRIAMGDLSSLTAVNLLAAFVLNLIFVFPSQAEWDHFKPVEVLRNTFHRPETESEKPQPVAAPSFEKANLLKTEFDLENATIMAYLSVIAYHSLNDPAGTPDMDKIRQDLSAWKGFEAVPILAPPVQGFVLRGPDSAVVVIRGSDEWEDWRENLKAVFPARKEIGPKVYGKMAQLFPPELEPATDKHRTHLGFQKLADLIYPQVREALRGYEQSNVWFTGHSLGGAISTILNRDLHRKENFRKTGVYTFGAPMPGTHTNSNYFVTENIPAYRAEFNWDPVPTKPGGLSFHPVGELVHLSEDSGGSCEIEDESFLQRKARGFIAGTVIRPGDHSMVRYYNCLARIPRTQ